MLSLQFLSAGHVWQETQQPTLSGSKAHHVLLRFWRRTLPLQATAVPTYCIDPFLTYRYTDPREGQEMDAERRPLQKGKSSKAHHVLLRPISHPPLGTTLQEAAAAAGQGACGPTWPHPPWPRTPAMTDRGQLCCLAVLHLVYAAVQAEWVPIVSAMQVSPGMLDEWLQPGPAEWVPMLSAVQVIPGMAGDWLQGCDVEWAAGRGAVSLQALRLQETRLQGDVTSM